VPETTFWRRTDTDRPKRAAPYSGRRQIMRIGLFGGTFNPVHYGQLRVALEVCEAFSLDVCHLIPSSEPPHKTAVGLARAEDRLNMIRTAIAGTPCLQVSDAEITRSGPSYTIDTVRHFQASASSPSDLYLMIGRDAFQELHTWKSMDALLDTIPLIVMNRPTKQTNRLDRKAIETYLNTHAPGGNYRFSETDACFSDTIRPPIYFFDVTLLDISSTDIRQRVREGRSIRYLVPPQVDAYINDKGLYR